MLMELYPFLVIYSPSSQLSYSIAFVGADFKFTTSSVFSSFSFLFLLFFTLLLGSIGFMNPDRRSNIINYGLILFVFMGIPGGFISSKLYRHLGGKSWLKNALLTCILFPGICFGCYTLINFLLIIENSTAAVNFGDIFSLLVLWLCCSSPLVLMGSFFGVKNKGIKVFGYKKILFKK